MNLGKLDRRILVQSRPTEKDSGGEFSGEWSAVFSTWASVKHQASTQGPDEGSEIVADSVTFIIRYRTNITTDMRIIYRSEYYEIVGIKEIARNQFLEVSGLKRSNW